MARLSLQAMEDPARRVYVYMPCVTPPYASGEGCPGNEFAAICYPGPVGALFIVGNNKVVALENQLMKPALVAHQTVTTDQMNAIIACHTSRSTWGLLGPS
jgi:hypothetical protein